MSSSRMAATAHDDTSFKETEPTTDQSSDQSVAGRNKKPQSTVSTGFSAVNAVDSQPMTATTSSSTLPDNTDPPTSSSSTPAPTSGPYGTRSRNRGSQRPNYAEDHDIDADLEFVTSKNNTSKRPSSANQNSNRTNTPNSDGDKSTGASTRRTQAVVNSTTKEPIPGMSTFSANPNAGNGSRKRKQPGSNQTVQGSSTPNGANSSKKFIASASRPESSSVSNMMTFNNCRGYLKNGKLKADDGTVLAPNDHVYLICEPPGEPYYLARIMEFLPSKSNTDGPIESVRVNWFYRPRDIQRSTGDMRLVFASMHSDTCPLTSLRGKCRILHRSEIDNLEEYKKTKDSFWFEKMYDRYIQRYYDVIPTKEVINVPPHVKKVLDERWKFVLVEMGRRAELTSASKSCKRCNEFAASIDSVDCAVCKDRYHMRCVRPPITKKPARGFAWACAACSRAQERKLEARNTPIVDGVSAELKPDPDLHEEEEEDPAQVAEVTRQSTPAIIEQVRHPTAEQIAEAKMWPFRYLGIHCRVEDALDYDDRIYPRASSRIGGRHQANVTPWYGHPVRYVKAPETKKKNQKGGGKKDAKLSKEALAAVEAEKAERARRPKWIMDEPPGYIRRGEDEPILVNGKEVYTAQLQFKMPDASQLPIRGEDDAPGSSLGDAEREKFIDDYMKEAKKVAISKGIEQFSTNFLDKALKILYEENYSTEAALARLKTINKYKDLKEPHLRPEEIKLFESGVAKYGSELRHVTKHVGTVPHRDIVRYYYMWKKTPQGRKIWGNFEGRKGKQAAKKADNIKLLDDIADDHDDSAFDNDKAAAKKRGFICKFCSTRSSRQWRRAPGVPPGTTQSGETVSKRDKGLTLTVALCHRCSILWRKYGIHWEDADEVAKRIVQGGSKSWRRRYEEQLLAQLLTSSESDVKINSTTAATAATLGIPVTQEMTKEPSNEPPKKKTKGSDKETGGSGTQTPSEAVPKKKAVEKPNEPPPLTPEPPRIKVLPCAICKEMDPIGDQHLSCRDCRLTVHRACYGVPASRTITKWFCDMCSNDKNPVISTSYECVLCPVTWTEHELMEPPKVSHKKKTEREREKERLEKDMVAEAIKLYRQRQEEMGKPIGPREALKRTDGNNWVHVVCAVWHPEVKFGNSKELDPAESLALIPSERYRDTCKLCKTNKGAVVSCHYSTCNTRFHVGCAHQAGYRFGFDVTPVKSSRRDSVATIKLGEETGAVTAAIWCPHHTISGVVHEMSEPTEVDGLNTLQLYVQTYKQADLTLTGTMRKAAHVQQSVGASVQGGASRRTALSVNGSQKENQQVSGKGGVPGENQLDGQCFPKISKPKTCYRCHTTFSPKWWIVEISQRLDGNDNSDGRQGLDSDDGRVHLAKDPLYECHKCHFRKKIPSPAPSDIRPSPFGSSRDASVSAGRGPEFPQHSVAPSPHGHPTQLPPVLPVPPPLVRPASEWRPEYDQRPGDFGNHLLRNGPPPPDQRTNGMPLGPPAYHGAPPPPPHVNGYHSGLPPHHQGPLPHPAHYANGIPPPPPIQQSYPAHHNPYGPISSAPPPPPPPPPPTASQPPYTSGVSPPTPHFVAPISTLPPPTARMYPAERVIAPNVPSPSLSRRSVDPQPPATSMDQKSTGAPSDKPITESSSRTNGPTGGSSGASASPSLKNLLL
ncbi:hypothetical protein VTO42DRAFT_6742 [Malbranchea cinnamomea]